MDSLLIDDTFFTDIDSIQKLSDTRVVRFFNTETYSLFRTLQICWMDAADCDTLSRDSPSRTNSSFTAVEIVTTTPG
jgi:hypothetical protein